MGFERALGVSREVRSVALSQGPGATFPEMSQAPALSGVFQNKGWVGVESSTLEGAWGIVSRCC